MCWNWQVSLCFSLLQWVAIVYLFRRNKFMDRWLSAMQIPIATQEFLQFLLWAYAIDDTTTKYQCSALNQYLSYNILIVIMFITPLWSFVALYKSADFISFQSICRHANCSNWRQKIVFSLLIVHCFLFVGYIIAVAIDDGYLNDSKCTFVSANGHQEWAIMAVNVHNSWWFVNLIGMTYISVTFIPLFTYRPLWLFLFTLGYGLLSSIISVLATSYDGTLLTLTSLRLADSGEWGSVWCWANSVSIMWVIAHAWLVPKLLEKYPIEEPMQGRCERILFYGTNALFREKESKDVMTKRLEVEVEQGVCVSNDTAEDKC
eukprot:47110_1